MRRLTSLLPCSFAVLSMAAFHGCARTTTAPPQADGSLSPATAPQVAGAPGATLQPPAERDEVRARCTPPVGWKQEPLKVTDKSKHLVWISPSGSTAYGVLNITHTLMSLASDDRILDEFVKGARQLEGSADLLEKHRDSSLAGGIGGLNFVTRGGTYTVHGHLISRGRYAWIWYAGTLTGKPVVEDELKTAEMARDATQVAVTTNAAK